VKRQAGGRSVKTIRVMIADDHLLFRQGVASVIKQEADMEVIGEASTGTQAVEYYPVFRPDVSLIDLVMPGLDGVDVIRELCRIDARARIIVLSTYDTHEDIERALTAGALGYLVKDVSAHELIGAIRSVHAGMRRVSPTVAGKLAERHQQVRLTMRELEILRLVVEGKANKQIAAALHVSEETVKSHVANLVGKLGAANRTEAVAVAIRRGLVRLPT
jgi:two-component system NarL family response regulator